MPFIIQQELVEIWKQLLRGVQQGIWYALITTDDFGCNLQAATNLNALEYDTLLLSSGIIFKRGDITMINKAKLDHLQTALKENIILHITRIKLQREGKRAFYIAVGQPLSNPSVQAKINPRVLPNRRGNGLDQQRLLLLERLCAERASAEEPELIVDEQLPLLPQEQDNILIQAEETQQPRPARRRRVLQELQLPPSPDRRTRTRRQRDEPQQEEANQPRPHRHPVAQEDPRLLLPPEQRIRPLGNLMNDADNRERRHRQLQAQLQQQIAQQRQQLEQQQQQIEDLPKQTLST